MMDASTQKPLHVSVDGNAGPYIMVPVQQIGDLCTLLDAHNISYWVDEDAISIDGKPEVTVVNLRPGTDAATVQSILDSASSR